MNFVWDERKNQSNLRKHGLALSVINEMQWDHAVTFEFQMIGTEERELVIGPVGNRLVVAVMTERGNAVRVISLRYATQREIERWRQEI